MPPHKRGPAASVAEMDDMARGIEMTDLRDDNARLRGCATRPRQAVAAAGLYNMDKKDEVKQLCRDLCSVDYTVGVSQLRNADSSLDLYTNKPELAAWSIFGMLWACCLWAAQSRSVGPVAEAGAPAHRRHLAARQVEPPHARAAPLQVPHGVLLPL